MGGLATENGILKEVSFLQKGQGKDMLFLHGYLSCKESFTAQINYFSRFYRVTAIDFLGFGQSGKLPAPFSVGDYAAWLKEVALALNIDRPNVIAHSFGCRVAVKAAAQDSGFFDKILLTGPAGIILKRGLGYKIKVKAYRCVKRIAPKLAEKRFGSAEYKALSPLMKESYKKIVNEDLRTCAKRVKNPVLIVEGKSDFVTTLAEAEIYEKSFQKARLVQTDGGHFAFAENPLAFNLIAEEFFYE